MPLTGRERFALVERVVESIVDDWERWSWSRLGLLFQQFDLRLSATGTETAAEVAGRVIGAADDTTLVEVAAIILNASPDSVRDTAIVGENTGLWRDDYLRVFLSHSAAEKQLLDDVSRELAVFGVDGFVAHTSMEPEKSWQPQIEQALRTAEAFVAIVHPPFNTSAWCQQEVGWARGRGMPSYFIRAGADPLGFPSPTQWPSAFGLGASEIALMIVNWLERQELRTASILDRLISGLAEAGNYYDAEAAANRISEFSEMTDASWRKLAVAYWSNDQVHHGVLANRALKPFYKKHDKEFPPPKPS
jgi:hypothetical protein